MKSLILVFIGIIALGQCQIPLGQVPTTVTSFIKNAANFATNTINSRSNSMHWYVLTGIHNASMEASNGMMYRMDITLQESTCRNSPSNNDATVLTCSLVSGGMVRQCYVEVNNDPGNTPRETLKSFNCQ